MQAGFQGMSHYGVLQDLQSLCSDSCVQTLLLYRKRHVSDVVSPGFCGRGTLRHSDLLVEM